MEDGSMGSYVAKFLLNDMKGMCRKRGLEIEDCGVSPSDLGPLLMMNRKAGWLVPEDEAFIYGTYRIPEALYSETYFVCEGATISSSKIAELKEIGGRILVSLDGAIYDTSGCVDMPRLPDSRAVVAGIVPLRKGD